MSLPSPLENLEFQNFGTCWSFQVAKVIWDQAVHMDRLSHADVCTTRATVTQNNSFRTDELDYLEQPRVGVRQESLTGVLSDVL